MTAVIATIISEVLSSPSIIGIIPVIRIKYLTINNRHFMKDSFSILLPKKIVQ